MAAKRKGIVTFAHMNGRRLLLYVCFSLAALCEIFAQGQLGSENMLPVTVYKGDTIPVVHMRDVYIYSKVFSSRRKEKEWWRMVRDVQKTLPLAREIRNIIVETYEYQLTLPNDKAREKHMKKVEKELMKTYKPVMTKLTLRQGKLLIKLVDRECNQTSYALIKVFRGKFRAGFYQAFASMFGATLKSDYDPEGADADIEEIIFLLENGMI